MNKSSKGYRNEKVIYKAYHDNGYDIYRSPNVRNGDNDIFNLWDLIAHDIESVRLIQVKSHPTDVRKFKTDSYHWLKYYSNPNLIYELFIVQPKFKGGIRKWHWDRDVNSWVEDLDNFFRRSKNGN
jgi:hypothetical protein